MARIPKGYKDFKAVELEEKLLQEQRDSLTQGDFEVAEFDEENTERIGYSNYSYLKSTIQQFRKHKVAVFLIYLMLAMILFTFIQPLLPNQYDPNVANKYEQVIVDKWGNERVNLTTASKEPPYLQFVVKSWIVELGSDEGVVAHYKYISDKYTKEHKIKVDEKTADLALYKEYTEMYFEEHGKFWLGTDKIGRDLWARIWSGARTSLFIGFAVAIIEAIIGITVGVIWGYVRKLDFILTELYNVLDNIPNTLLLILISFILKPSVRTLIFAMCLTGWIQMARFIRNQIYIIRDRDYNTASRCLGTPTRKILIKNCLPYLISVIMLRMALTIPGAIGSEVFITYIGLGLPTEIPSLGNLIIEGRKLISVPNERFLLVYPTIILSIITISFYVIGNAFSDASDPKNHR